MSPKSSILLTRHGVRPNIDAILEEKLTVINVPGRDADVCEISRHVMTIGFIWISANAGRPVRLSSCGEASEELLSFTLAFQIIIIHHSSEPEIIHQSIIHQIIHQSIIHQIIHQSIIHHHSSINHSSEPET